MNSYILFTIIILLLASATVTYKSKDPHATLSNFILGFILALMPILNYQIINKDTPKAIDVYRGNTRLQIYYERSIPIDSVVVFKNNPTNKTKK